MALDLDPRRWSPERTALAVAVIALAVTSVAGTLIGVDFATRAIVSIAVGFMALVLASYLLTGSPLPPDDAGDA